MIAVPLSFQDVWRESQFPSMKLGTIASTPDGSLWQYQQAAEALVQGNVVTKTANNGQVVTQNTQSGTHAVNTRRITDASNSAFTVAALPAGWYKNGTDPAANVYPDRYVNLGHSYYVEIVDGEGQNQFGPIYNRVNNDSVDVWWMQSDDGKLDAALTGSGQYIVTCNTRVIKATAAVDNLPVGVVQRNGGITDEYFFWSLIKGKGIALWDTTVNLDGDTIVTSSSAVAGTVEATTGTATVAEYAARVGTMSTDSDSAGKVLLNIDVTENVVPENRVPLPITLDLAWPQMFN